MIENKRLWFKNSKDSIKCRTMAINYIKIHYPIMSHLNLNDSLSYRNEALKDYFKFMEICLLFHETIEH